MMKLVLFFSRFELIIFSPPVFPTLTLSAVFSSHPPVRHIPTEIPPRYRGKGGGVTAAPHVVVIVEAARLLSLFFFV